MDAFPFSLAPADPGGRRRERPVLGSVRAPAGRGPAPVAIIVPAGRPLSTSGSSGPSVEERIAAHVVEAGALAVTVHLGDDPLRGEPARGALTPPEVERVVTAVFERMIPAPERIDIRRVALVGVGGGAAATIAEAAQDTRVGALVSVSPGDAAEETVRAARTLGRPHLVVESGAATEQAQAAARALYFAGVEGMALELAPARDAAVDALAGAAARFVAARLPSPEAPSAA